LENPKKNKKGLKIARFSKFSLLIVMIIASVFSLTHVSLAQVLLIAPSKINLGSVKPGDTLESKKRILIKFSLEIDVEKVTVAPFKEEDFVLKLEGKDKVKIPATYSCKKVFYNKEAGIIHIEVTIKVSEIKWKYIAGKYRGEIIMTFSEIP